MGLAWGYCRRCPWRDGLWLPKEQALLSNLSETMKLEGFLSINVSTLLIKVQRIPIPVPIPLIQNTADWK